MRTARARALLGITVLLTLTGALVVVAASRGRNDDNAQEAVVQREAIVAAMESGRIQLSREATSAIAALMSPDPSVFARAYEDARASGDEDLSQAYAILLETDGTNAATAFEMLSTSLNYLRQATDSALATAASPPSGTTADEMAAQLQSRFDQALIELDRLLATQKLELATERSAASHASDVTLALLVSWAAIALLAGSAITIGIVVSITRPIEALRLKLSAITSGDRTEPLSISGPEEITSLASEFERMASECRDAEDGLKAVRANYQILFENSLAALYVHDLEGRVIDANSAALQLLGISRDELPRLSIFDFFEESRHPTVTAVLNEIAEKGGGGDVRTTRLRRRDGDIIDIEYLTSLIKLDDGSVAILGALHDISYRIRAEEVLRGSEDKYREIFENVQDIYYRTDAAGIITEIGPAVQRWGYTRDQLVGTQVLDVYVDPEERQGLLNQLMSRGEVTDYEVKLKAADGSINYSSVGSHVVRGPGGEMMGVEGVLRDITQRKKAEESLREQMRRDPLTGVLNHAAVVDELRQLVSQSSEEQPCAVLMSDLDGLKAINDTFGHAVGDNVLVAIVESLSRNGALVGRYGGDEFITVLPGAGRSEAEAYMKEVLTTLDRSGPIDQSSGARIPVLVSMGIAICPFEASRIEELIQLADSAMYAEKRKRREASSALFSSRHRGSEADTARIVGEIVPYLTTTGNLEEKLRLVARRLSVATGYDAVSFMLFGTDPEAPPSLVTFARGPEKYLSRWNTEEVKISSSGRKVKAEGALDRPRIMRDLLDNPHFSQSQRELLERAGLKSAMSAPMMWNNELIGILGVASEREDAFRPNDAQTLSAVATQVTAIVGMENLLEELRAASGRIGLAHVETVMLLAAAAEAHDRTTGKHLQNVRRVTEQLAVQLGYDEEDARELGLSAVLHDMGKIRVADSVLANTGRLTSEEWELMQQHAVWGEQFLTGRSGFELAARIARSHHERWDGGGYPDGVKGDAIDEAATIVAVADSFDAMTSDRPYKPGRSSAAAIQEIITCSGSQFNPKVVQALVQLYKQHKLPRRRSRPFIEDQAA